MGRAKAKLLRVGSDGGWVDPRLVATGLQGGLDWLALGRGGMCVEEVGRWQ